MQAYAILFSNFYAFVACFCQIGSLFGMAQLLRVINRKIITLQS